MHAQPNDPERLNSRSTLEAGKPRAEEKGELGNIWSVWMAVRGRVLHKKESARKNMLFRRCDVGGEPLPGCDTIIVAGLGDEWAR
jgi:hypothetical protein